VLRPPTRWVGRLAGAVPHARQYLAIETLRLGDRLRVSWSIADMPGDALLPPLVLQPLIENAVYHGIEPSPGGGEIAIEIVRGDKQVRMTLTNPVPAESRHAAGNRMAMANIRERLQLHFDAEASLKSELHDGVYRVTIRIPYLSAPA
jgi:two-component system sensor histidine kinase AlgZ